MTGTPPLGQRVLLVGIGVVVLVLVLVDAFVYLQLRASLDRSLDELLADRAAIARAEGARLPPASGARRPGRPPGAPPLFASSPEKRRGRRSQRAGPKP